MDQEIIADGLRLSAHFARPATGARVPALVLCHGFPQPPRGSVASGITFPGFADRIARDAGWAVLTFNFRGAGGSEGDFSIRGWLDDVRAAVDVVVAREDTVGVWIAGAGLGGSLAICAAAEDERIRGVAAIATPASLREWVREPSRFLAHARRMGVIHTPGYPRDPLVWAREIADLDVLTAARKLPPRPLLVLHGTDDDVVPLDDARAIADAHGSAELRIVVHAGYRLRHDPRAVALLLGWLDRQHL